MARNRLNHCWELGKPAPLAPTLPDHGMPGVSGSASRRRGAVPNRGSWPDRQVPANDLLAQVLDLGPQLRRNYRRQIMEGGNPYAAVRQRPDVRPAREGSLDDLPDRLHHGHIHVLHHRGEHDVGILRKGLVAVRVDPDHVAAAFPAGPGSADSSRAGNREEDFGALLDLLQCQLVTGLLL